MYRYVQNRVLVYLKVVLMGMDAIFLNLAFGVSLALLVFYGVIDQEYFLSNNYYSLLIIFNLVAVISAVRFKLYSDSTVERLESVFRSTSRALLLHVLVFSLCTLLGHSFKGMSWFLVVLTFAMIVYCAGSRLFLTYFYTKSLRRFNWNKRVVLIGHNDYLAPVAGTFAKDQAFYSLDTISYVDEDHLRDKEAKLARFKQYFEKVSKAGIHDVILVNSPDISEYSQELIMAADHQCVQLNFVPVITANITYSNNSSLAVELPILKSHEEPMSTMENRIKKRIVDLLISGFVIVFILSWLVPIIGLLIKIQSPGPIFFKQPRSGRNNKTFGCYKFRSMVVNKESNNQQATKADKRITPIGQFLRKTNLDEFPQFINVFLGQMSVIGPRPHMLSHTEHYSKLIQHYMVRHFVKPGITGWAQTNGYRGETKDPQLMAKRVEYDLEYMSNWSAMLDFRIICMTVINMLRGEKNAY